MTPISVRLPADLIKSLRAQAQSRGLDVSAFIRSQLISTAERPVNVLHNARRAS